ncbi:MAG TPA: bifunctional phosphoribosyl-AMP cyclohydrolase/phosphoribosyl-ATP diphosphatase HisIE [Candidatus Acetothermia bacterium]|nr:bifunctional phosphoribosyl-AMP cyclohydrolase/phosphoribosyl-ATP diphosphatase HisIE [Candidatus Acetothermia bacterium]
MSELKLDLEEIRWNADGLVPVIAQGVDGRVLMLAYANREALQRTLGTGFMHYWSRSRQKLWQKGETSGHVQRVLSLHLDCDRDTVLARVAQTGPACHLGSPTCFGDLGADIFDELWAVFADRAANQREGSYVNRLLGDERRLRQKVGEEGVEVVLAASNDELIYEAADLIFHLCVLLFARSVSWSEVLTELERRRR